MFLHTRGPLDSARGDKGIRFKIPHTRDEPESQFKPRDAQGDLSVSSSPSTAFLATWMSVRAESRTGNFYECFLHTRDPSTALGVTLKLFLTGQEKKSKKAYLIFRFIFVMS